MHWIDPDYLPEIAGTVDQFLVNKHGEADGFLLTDGGEVHVPPHLSSRLLRDLRPGGKVRVRGVRPRGVEMVACDGPRTAPRAPKALSNRPFMGPRARRAAPFWKTGASSGCRRTRQNASPICSRRAPGFRSMATVLRRHSARWSKPARSARPPKPSSRSKPGSRNMARTTRDQNTAAKNTDRNIVQNIKRRRRSRRFGAKRYGD